MGMRRGGCRSLWMRLIWAEVVVILVSRGPGEVGGDAGLEAGSFGVKTPSSRSRS